MTIKLYNTLTRHKEDFVPLKPGYVSMYACGPTVYNYAHIGNGRMAVIFDVLYRLLRRQYASVTYVSNITDVDDKIMEAAKQTGDSIDTITEKYTRIYNEDMHGLGNLLPDVQPKATEHIPDMIAIIERLVARGHAYAVDHGAGQGKTVLFHVPSYPDYGALSGRSRDEQIAGARVEVSPDKRDPADFVLWKPSADDQPGWASPWGRGRPGWHIECSAMSAKHLGLPFDIHGGGADLKFPHHENEIAQSCCATPQDDHPVHPNGFARYWVHNGFVTVAGDKMSKSLGNVMLPHELLTRIPGEVLRWALLSSHYRAPLDWSEQKITEAQKHLDALYEIFKKAQTKGIVLDPAHGKIDPEILSALEDDLNTPLAQTRLIHLQKEIHASGQMDDSKIQDLFASLWFMGFAQQDPQQWGHGGGTAHGPDIDENWIKERLSARDQAKRAKNFALSDQIRAELLGRGIVVKDTPEGPVWMRQNA